MAVENKYVNADTAADKLTTAAFVHGDKTVTMQTTFEVATADTDASVYRLFKNVPADLIPVQIHIATDAITAASNYDLGFYKPSVGGVDGAAIDADKLANTLVFSSASTWASPKDGLENLNLDEVDERIYELCGDTLATKEIGYDIALTANGVGSGAGTISVKAIFVQG
jgi:hypothetical protein